jgi:hypothetical protein
MALSTGAAAFNSCARKEKQKGGPFLADYWPIAVKVPI